MGNTAHHGVIVKHRILGGTGRSLCGLRGLRGLCCSGARGAVDGAGACLPLCRARWLRGGCPGADNAAVFLPGGLCRSGACRRLGGCGLRRGRAHRARGGLRFNALGIGNCVGTVLALVIGAQCHSLALGAGQGLRLLRFLDGLGGRLLHNGLRHRLRGSGLGGVSLRLGCGRLRGGVLVDLPPLYRLHGALDTAAGILGSLLLRKAASFFVLIL